MQREALLVTARNSLFGRLFGGLGFGGGFCHFLGAGLAAFFTMDVFFNADAFAAFLAVFAITQNLPGTPAHTQSGYGL